MGNTVNYMNRVRVQTFLFNYCNDFSTRVSCLVPLQSIFHVTTKEISLVICVKFFTSSQCLQNKNLSSTEMAHRAQLTSLVSTYVIFRITKDTLDTEVSDSLLSPTMLDYNFLQ